jgi:uncharacterized protein (DUF1330 family)
MPSYLIVNAMITDQELLDAYHAAVGPTLVGHDVVTRVATNMARTIEGEPAGPRVVVMEFPDEDAFHAWYDSPAYQEVIGLRLKATQGFAVLAQGRS